MHQLNESDAMPNKDPSNWQALIDLLLNLWPQIYAAGLAMLIALVRAIHAGGRPMKSILEAILCGCLTLAVMPLLSYFGMPQDMAVAAGAAIAFLGVEWVRDRLEALYDKIIGRWLK
ncbi:phage holin, lambda family [Vreelandella profundi]|uniref:phage holin, lambda family n=1 Tax=Vreelandella profundi TaxID=2852117 RepID=UPI001F0213E3|nr:phage holin, lambda family [Halomonas profundi]